MIRILLVLALALALRPAHASTVELGRFGAWEVHGGTTNQGRRTCGVVTELPGNRLFLIQYLWGEDALLVRVARRSWSIPRDAQVQVRTVIGALSWTARADPGRDEIRWLITASTMREWERAFRDGTEMRVEFLTGSEPPWTVSLTGSNRALSAFGSCIRALSDMGGGRAPSWPTQPHSAPQPAPAPPAPRGVGPEWRT